MHFLLPKMVLAVYILIFDGMQKPSLALKGVPVSRTKQGTFLRVDLGWSVVLLRKVWTFSAYSPASSNQKQLLGYLSVGLAITQYNMVKVSGMVTCY